MGTHQSPIAQSCLRLVKVVLFFKTTCRDDVVTKERRRVFGFEKSGCKDVRCNRKVVGEEGEGF